MIAARPPMRMKSTFSLVRARSTRSKSVFGSLSGIAEGMLLPQIGFVLPACAAPLVNAAHKAREILETLRYGKLEVFADQSPIDILEVRFHHRVWKKKLKRRRIGIR